MANIDPKDSDLSPRQRAGSGASSDAEERARQSAPGAAGETKTGAKAAGRDPSDKQKHRLRGAAFDPDFEDAESDSSAVRNARDEKISES